MTREFRSHSPFPKDRAFVVQFSAEDADTGFTGRAEHILSGRSVQFRSSRALLEFLRAALEGARNEPDGDDRGLA
jgi:hypothetical protein